MSGDDDFYRKFILRSSPEQNPTGTTKQVFNLTFNLVKSLNRY